MSGVVKVISPYIPPSVVSVDYCEMESMFNLPYYPNKVIENSFLIGNSVKIVSGALQNYIGKIKEIRGKRAFIETNILKNFSTDIEISLNSLELVSC
jgi:transcription antitermination factor NusG